MTSTSDVKKYISIFVCILTAFVASIPLPQLFSDVAIFVCLFVCRQRLRLVHILKVKRRRIFPFNFRLRFCFHLCRLKSLNWVREKCTFSSYLKIVFTPEKSVCDLITMHYIHFESFFTFFTISHQCICAMKSKNEWERERERVAF